MTKYNTIPYWVNRRYNQNQRIQKAHEIEIPIVCVSNAAEPITQKSEISLNTIALIALIVFFLGEALIQAWDNQQIWDIVRM